MNATDKLIFRLDDLVAFGYGTNKREIYRKIAQGKLPPGRKMGEAKNAHREWPRQELIDWEIGEDLYLLRPRPPVVTIPKLPRETIWSDLPKKGCG